MTCENRPASLGGRHYALSLRLLALAAHALQRATVPRVAAPFVSELHEHTGHTAHTAHLLVPGYDSVVCLAHAQDGVQAVPALRELAPCHCTAGGKALLSDRPRWRDAILRENLEVFTPRTTTDPSVLRRELDETAIRGYAIEAGEHKPEQHGVAAVVRSEAGEAVAAIAVTATRSLDVRAAARHVTRTAGVVSTITECRRRSCSTPSTSDSAAQSGCAARAARTA